MRFGLCFAAVLMLATPAFAEGPVCLCGPAGFAERCEAEITRNADHLDFTVDTPQCSRVDWYLGDTPLATMVKGGFEMLQLEDIEEGTETRVRACRVCRSETAPPPVPVEDVLPIVRVAPLYPRSALATGTEGYVDLKFTVKANGSTADIVVTYSTDSIFERSAKQAVSKFKYKPRVVDGKVVDTPGVEARIRFQRD
ncbi:MAG: energy transducer TonB [Pseudomonadota bacterium]